MDTEVLIIGGGVLGISLGFHLSHQKIPSIIIEKEAVPASHASGKNAGMLRQLYRHPQLTNWAMRSIASWPEQIRKDYFQQTGSYIVGRELPNHHRELFEQRQVECQFNNEKKKVPAIYTATDGLLDSPGYVNALHSLTDRQYCQSKFRTTVEHITQADGGWEITLQDKSVIRTNKVVNAAGAWINSVLNLSLPELKLETQAFARYLYLVHGFQKDEMPEEDCGFYWQEEDAWYIRLWDPDSRLMSVCDLIPANPDAYVASSASMHKAAETLSNALPEQAPSLSIGRSWHCFRTYTEDQLPVWGEDPLAPGLFWLAAFGGFGMSTSFAATLDAAAYLAGEQPKVSPQLLPTRARTPNLKPCNKSIANI